MVKFGHHILSVIIGTVAGSIAGTLIAIVVSTQTMALCCAFALAGLVAASLGVKGTASNAVDSTMIVIRPWPVATGFLFGVILIAFIGKSYLLPAQYEISAPSTTSPTLLPFGN